MQSQTKHKKTKINLNKMNKSTVGRDVKTKKGRTKELTQNQENKNGHAERDDDRNWCQQLVGGQL